ncbi:hypothetical protein FM076_14755 [Streptomyces albus subsp. chlorinus]|uniref:hypothetical protein n=1 Tax=Streptomyces albus TaxID=1888 RepID=UPI001570A719|nr:hypothetical protein [Streptomyces albus]NSC22377.1 hypothetical protein [Streptomyces albus subsp. chlorinus]
MNSPTPPCDDDHHERPDSQVLSLRVEAALLERLADHAAKRGMSVQDYVVQTLVRDDFDERFRASVEETERFYGRSA